MPKRTRAITFCLAPKFHQINKQNLLAPKSCAPPSYFPIYIIICLICLRLKLSILNPQAMASLTTLLLLSCLLANSASTLVAYSLDSYNLPKPAVSSLKVMNAIDSCWRAKSNWAVNRKALADCVVGFGKGTLGGKYGAIYVVTDPSDDPVNPKLGTLRYGVIQTKPLWIIFAKDMVIRLQNELIMNSFKTIDGRGAKVEIANGPCITIQGVSHVIIHGISIHDCKPGKSGQVRSSPDHVGRRGGSDGDAIDIFASSYVWVDHCYLARAADGLIDVIHASTAVTISNNYFEQHDKVGREFFWLV